MARRITLLVMPPASTSSRSLSISGRGLKVAIWSMAAFLSVAAFYAVGYSIRAHRESMVVTLTSEQARMTDQVHRLSGEIASLRTRMRHFSTRDELLRLAADLPPVDADVRRAGVGGSHLDWFSDDLSLGYGAVRNANTLQSELGQLIRESDYQSISFGDIQHRLDSNQDMLKQLPSSLPVSLALGYISSGFGERRDPFTGRMRMHAGLDIAGPRGTRVYATADGKVVSAGYGGGLGYRVIIKHQDGFKTIYGHMARTLVARGQEVARHELIGEMGSSGRSTAPHLHYGVTQDGRPVNPWHYLPLN